VSGLRSRLIAVISLSSSSGFSGWPSRNADRRFVATFCATSPWVIIRLISSGMLSSSRRSGCGEPIAELGIELLNLGFFGLVVVLAGVLAGATKFGVGDRVGSGEGGAFACPVDASPVAGAFGLSELGFEGVDVAAALDTEEFPGVVGPVAPFAFPVVMPFVAVAVEFQFMLDPVLAGFDGAFPGLIEGGLGRGFWEFAFNDDDVGQSLGDVGEGGGDDAVAMGFGGVADGPGEVGEEVGATVEVTEFAGVLDEALDRGEGNDGMGGHRLSA
jgi:hypothetical protein